MDEAWLRALGAAVRERREVLSLTQEALTERSGVPQRRVWEVEAAAGNPTMRTLCKLARGLEWSPGEMFARAAWICDYGSATT